MTNTKRPYWQRPLHPTPELTDAVLRLSVQCARLRKEEDPGMDPYKRHVHPRVRGFHFLGQGLYRTVFSWRGYALKWSDHWDGHSNRTEACLSGMMVSRGEYTVPTVLLFDLGHLGSVCVMPKVRGRCVGDVDDVLAESAAFSVKKRLINKYGINDLHGENIMITDKGRMPVVIDLAGT